MILREKPKDQLVDHAAYALTEDATLADYQACADWVRFYGGVVKYVDEDGLLVTAGHGDDGHRYVEWISAPALVVHTPEFGDEFSNFGHSMHEYYLIEPTEEAPR